MHILRRFTVKPILFCNSPYKQIWFRKLENLVNMVFLVEVNNRYGTNLNELCIKNATPHVGTAGPEFLLRSKARNIRTSSFFSRCVLTTPLEFGKAFHTVYPITFGSGKQLFPGLTATEINSVTGALPVEIIDSLHFKL